MHRFKSLLVSIPGDSPEPSLLRHAAALARRNGAALTLIAVVEPVPWYSRLLPPATQDPQATALEEGAARLEALAAPLRQDGLSVSIAVRTGRPYLETVREVLRGGHDLVVKRAEPDQGLLFGSSDMHLLRSCPCPVWLFKPALEDQPFRRILVAVDPALPPDEADVFGLKEGASPEQETLNVALMELGSALAELEAGELHVVHAWSAPGEELLRRDKNLTKSQVDDYVESARAESEKALDRLASRVPDPRGCRQVHLLKGMPSDVIPDFAKAQHVDLIVMGSVARTGIPGFLIGNTAETIFHRVDCSVLTLKPEGFVSPVTLDTP